MPECSQSSKRQRPDYLADFTSGSSADNSCSSSDEDDEERRKAGGGREGEKKEKKVSYDLGDSKEKHRPERSGEATLFCIHISFLKTGLHIFIFLKSCYLLIYSSCKSKQLPEHAITNKEFLWPEEQPAYGVF